MPARLTETTPLSEAGKATTKSRMLVHAISAGLGSSGYYSPEVLSEAADNGLISKGTPLYLDHPSASEANDRPERSVRDIAAVFTEAATYDAGAQALVGEIQVFAPFREVLSEMAPYIGLSIRGSATDVTEGEYDGRPARIVEGLASIDSVDFVTRAGRGGKVVELLESAATAKKAVERGVSEATVNDTREALQTALRAAYGREATETESRVWVYVRDFDDDTVWFEVEAYGDSTDSGLFGQGYIHADGLVTLTGARTEVRVVTTYVPATRPDSTGTTPSTESEEDTMPEIKIDEAEHTRLVTEAGRVATLEAENAQLKESAAAGARRDRAIVLIGERATEAKVTFTPLEQRGLLADLPVKEDASLDEETFVKAVDEAAATAKAVTLPPSGAALTGFGAYAGQPGTATATESATPVRSPWGRELQKGA